jgi:chromosome segregation ATPase
MIMAEGKKVEENIENLDSLKEKLIAVTSEIDAIKTSFTKSAEDLSRVQDMLKVGNIDDIGGIVEKYENKIEEAEKQRVEAAESSKKYSEELEKEKERLIKLWDAYKNQEEELSNIEKKLTEYEERAKAAEANVKQVEDDYNSRIKTLEQKVQDYEGQGSKFEEYKKRCEEFDDIQNKLEGEVHTLKQDAKKKDDEITYLNKKLTELKEMEDYSEYKKKYEEVNAEYEKEKERLTKLYQLYDETEAECKTLRDENKNWQNWYDTKMNAFEQLFSNAPPKHAPTEYHKSTPAPPPESPIEEDKPKTKKRLKFKK